MSKKFSSGGANAPAGSQSETRDEILDENRLGAILRDLHNSDPEGFLDFSKSFLVLDPFLMLARFKTPLYDLVK